MIKSFKGKTPVIASSAFVADNATIIGDVTIGENSSVWYGTVIRGDDGPVVIVSNTNIQDNSVVHAEEEGLVIGNNVTVGHNAIVHCKRVGDNVMLGMGSISLSGSEIGDSSVLGAGALLTQNKSIPAKSVAVGSPAKVLREATDVDVERTLNNAKIYVKLAKEHKNC